MIIKDSLDYVGERWAAEGGYRQALHIAIPLIFSSAGMAIQQFINRMFLAWYSPEAIAASMPAGLINFTFRICSSAQRAMSAFLWPSTGGPNSRSV